MQRSSRGTTHLGEGVLYIPVPVILVNDGHKNIPSPADPSGNSSAPISIVRFLLQRVCVVRAWDLPVPSDTDLSHRSRSHGRCDKTVFGPQSHIVQTHSPGTRRPRVWAGIRFLAPCAFPLSPRDTLSYWLTTNRRLFYVLSSCCVSPIFIRCCSTPHLPCCTGPTFYAFRRRPVALGFLVCQCKC